VTQPSEYAIRKARLIKCNADPELQALAIAACKRDLFTWINDWVWTYDPRESPSTLPFTLFPIQEDYLRWRRLRLDGRQHGLVEKTRGAGMTWLNVADQTHHWLFTSDFTGNFGSRKEELVDRLGDPKCIFEKIRFILRWLPPWMLPEGFDMKKHAGHLKIINPANGSIIAGEGGDNMGRGGRSTLYDWDEVAVTPRQESVERALSENTDTIYYTSTVNGQNWFWKKRSHLPTSCVFRSEWVDDPRRNHWELWVGDTLRSKGQGRDAPPGAIYPWYEDKKRKFDPLTIAIEYNIDYTASVEGIFIPAKWVQAAVNFAGCEAGGDRTAGLDVATSGKNRSVLVWRIGPVVQPPIDWQGQNTTETAFRAHDICVDNRIGHINFDADGVGAGVSGAYESAQDLQITYKAIHGAARASDRIWPGELRTSADKFANVRAEAWGLLRERFRKTCDHVNGIQAHDWREMISIPNHPSLIQQLSSVQGKHTTTGKILLQSKEQMRVDGIESPDFADALAYSELGGAPSADFLSSGARAGLRRK
jgi:hypothetical protein